MTINELKREMEKVRGEFHMSQGLIRHSEMEDCAGNDACPILVCLGHYRDANENKHAVRVALASGMSGKDARCVAVTSDYSEVEVSANLIPPDRREHFDPRLRAWMETNLLPYD